MIIDIHTHAWPPKISPKARENLENFFKVKLIGDPTVDTLLSYMQRNRIDISVICAVASRPEQVVSINSWLFSVVSPQIKAFAAMHPEYTDWKKELQRIKAQAHGIKFQPEFQNFYVDDEKFFAMYEEIEKLGLPVLFHCGEELSGTLLVRSSAKRIYKVMKRFPGLKIIAGHFGGFRLWEEAKEYLVGQDIYMDTAFCFGYMPDAQIKDMILKHRPDRVLFGTDFPLIDQKKDIESIEHLGLPEGLKAKILADNAKELLGM